MNLNYQAFHEEESNLAKQKLMVYNINTNTSGIEPPSFQSRSHMYIFSSNFKPNPKQMSNIRVLSDFFSDDVKYIVRF